MILSQRHQPIGSLRGFGSCGDEAEADWKLLQGSVAAFTPAHSNVTFELFDMFIANGLYQLKQMRGALTEPDTVSYTHLTLPTSDLV